MIVSCGKSYSYQYSPVESYTSIYSYIPSTDTWNFLGNAGASGRYNHEGFFVSNQVVIWGGLLKTFNSQLNFSSFDQTNTGYRILLAPLILPVTQIMPVNSYLYQKN